MPIFPLRPFRVTANQPLAQDAYELTLEPADGEPMFSFLPGQWVMMHLADANGSSWGRAAFTIASAPSESVRSLVLAIKIYGDFTKRAERLAVGDQVHLQGPYGVFVLQTGTDPICFFAGGIGITPFRCMIREMINRHDARSVVLFYSNQMPESASYLDELRELSRQQATIKLVQIFTRCEATDPLCEYGRLTAEVIQRHAPNAATGDAYLCGPKEFMDAIRGYLIQQGMDPKRIHQERFS